MARTPAIIRTGWWVAAAAIIISLATAWAILGPLFPRPTTDSTVSDFVVDRLRVPRDLVVRAMAKDGVRVLTEPPSMSPHDVDLRNEEGRGKLLVPDDRVIGVVMGDEARAYPLRLMRWHEVVNDRVGDTSIAVTYSPLCDSVAVYERGAADGRPREFGVSGLLYDSNTLLYDRRLEPSSSPLWSQFDGRAVAGSALGSAPRLPPLPVALATWEEWRARHPATRVLAPQPDLARLYKRDPYHSYFGSDLLRFPVRPLPSPGTHRLKDRVVVVTIDGLDHAYPLTDLAARVGRDDGEIEVEAGGLPLKITFRVDPGTAIVEAPTAPERLQAVRYGFWFAWYAFEGMIPDNGPSSDPGRSG